MIELTTNSVALMVLVVVVDLVLVSFRFVSQDQVSLAIPSTK